MKHDDKRFETRSPDGDGLPMVKGLEEGASSSCSQGVVLPQQGHEHARGARSDEGDRKPAAGSEPAESHTPSAEARSAPLPAYDFKVEATRVCEAIGSGNGNMTVQCALREAYAAGQLALAGVGEAAALPSSTAPLDTELMQAASKVSGCEWDCFHETIPVGNYCSRCHGVAEAMKAWAARATASTEQRVDASWLKVARENLDKMLAHVDMLCGRWPDGSGIYGANIKHMLRAERDEADKSIAHAAKEEAVPRKRTPLELEEALYLGASEVGAPPQNWKVCKCERCLMQAWAVVGHFHITCGGLWCEITDLKMVGAGRTPHPLSAELLEAALGLLRRWAYPDVNVPWDETKAFLAHASCGAAPSSTGTPDCRFMRPTPAKQDKPCSELRPHDAASWCGACLMPTWPSAAESEHK